MDGKLSALPSTGRTLDPKQNEIVGRERDGAAGCGVPWRNRALLLRRAQIGKDLYLLLRRIARRGARSSFRRTWRSADAHRVCESILQESTPPLSLKRKRELWKRYARRGRHRGRGKIKLPAVNSHHWKTILDGLFPTYLETGAARVFLWDD